MICTSLQNKTYGELLEILASPEVEMAEIRLDSCLLSDDEITDIFGNSDVPLVATCRISGTLGADEAERRLKLAAEAGARFADLEIEAPVQTSKNFQRFCRENGTEIIRSFHDFSGTPDMEMLQKALARCFRYGADIAKIACSCRSEEDAARIESLYSLLVEGVPSLQGRLIAFGMGEYGRESRFECLKRGAPFSYAALNDEEATAPGQWTAAQMRERIYGGRFSYHASGLRMPASKSFAQRAIISAALASGTSRLGGYSPCGDSESAISAACAMGAEVIREDGGATLVIKGMDAASRGITADRIIYNTTVISQAETPGLGAKCVEPAFADQFRDFNPAEKSLTVKKDGGDIDAITASTITSRAYSKAVETAVTVYDAIVAGMETADDNQETNQGE